MKNTGIVYHSTERTPTVLAELAGLLPPLSGEQLAALEADLGKPSFEGYMTELGLVREELRFHLKHLGRWARPRRVPTPLAHFPARSTVRPEPYGSVLILSPWNYPVQLSLMPLIGALAAGNCAVLKPSAYAPACSRALAELVARSLPTELAAVVEGGRAENQALLDLPFDYIFFTGSPSVGRVVMERAAARLTPVTLELGGKRPVIVAGDADLSLTARRILFGKLLNAGQTCVAPDYVLAQRDVLPEQIRLLQKELAEMLGEDPLSCPDYPRIVNAAHLRRLEGLLEGCEVLCGGQTGGGRMAPALVLPHSPAAPVMQVESFGPILPFLPFDTLEEAGNLPFTGGKRMVDVEKVRDIIDDIRLNMPAEIRQAKAIVQDRADIVESAKKEAEAIVTRAEDRARAMVAQEAIVKAAQQKATEILTSAQSQSREMRTTVTNYCENMLRHTEEQLAKSMTEVKTVRSTLRQSGKKATVRPAAQPQKPE